MNPECQMVKKKKQRIARQQIMSLKVPKQANFQLVTNESVLLFVSNKQL
jgi:hypothetical protein